MGGMGGVGRREGGDDKTQKTGGGFPSPYLPISLLRWDPLSFPISFFLIHL